MICLLLLLALLLETSCGQDEEAEPNPMPISAADVSSGSKSVPTVLSTTDSATRGTCLSNCDQPADSIFSFDEEKLLEVGNCAVQSARAFSTRDSLAIFIQADCGSASQLYVVRSTRDLGTTSDARLLLTRSCAAANSRVAGYSVAQSDGGFLVVAKCRVSAVAQAAFVVSLAADGSVISERELERLPSTDNSPYIVTWNAVTKTFGLAHDRLFRRIQESGTQLGGSIDLGSGSFPADQLMSHGGYWYALHGSKTGSNTTCSRISSAGTVQCDRVAMASGSYGPRVFHGADRIVRSYDGTIAVADFNLSNCKTEGDVAIGRVAEGETAGLLGSLNLNDRYGAVLFTVQRGALQIGVFTRQAPYSLPTIVSVADAEAFTSAEMVLSYGRVYVVYAKSGLVYGTRSKEPVN